MTKRTRAPSRAPKPAPVPTPTDAADLIMCTLRDAGMTPEAAAEAFAIALAASVSGVARCEGLDPYEGARIMAKQVCDYVLEMNPKRAPDDATSH